MGLELLAWIYGHIFDRKMIQVDIVASQISSIQTAAFLSTPRKNGSLTAEINVAAVYHPSIKLSAVNQ